MNSDRCNHLDIVFYWPIVPFSTIRKIKINMFTLDSASRGEGSSPKVEYLFLVCFGL